ncbi:MAG: restriction endonuclease, partial [Bacteroidales bacterium]|nr:restriction endonuclease [Bacteroidales bacterium]
SPWTLKNPDDVSPNKEEIIKKECYIFDFAPNRALNQIVDYSDKLNVEEQNHEKKVAEFISFLPILAYDGSTMKRVNATEILDIALSGTTSTLLARRWQSALLVNVDNNMLIRLLNNEKAINIIMNIEGFRSLPLKDNIETIINKSESVKNLKKKKKEDGLDKKEKKQLSDEEKEYQSKRKEIRDKLIKFATRIPIFMYLSDFREYSLQDVINKLEPNLFKKVTGLTKEDFSLLVSMGLFNESLMNDAVFKFKRYEDSSLRYVGINRYENENIGGYNTQISAEDFDKEY